MTATLGTAAPSEGARNTSPDEDRIPVALVDDHVMVRQGFSSWLGASGKDVEVVASASSVPELLTAHAGRARVVLLDVFLDDDSTVADNIPALRAAGAEVIVVSQSNDAEVIDTALKAGARSYLSKSADADELLMAIRAADRGELHVTRAIAAAIVGPGSRNRPALSPKEVRVIRLYGAGMLLSSVATRLGIAEGTVKTHVDRIRRKYEKAGRDARSRIALYRCAAEDGYLDD